MRLKNHDAELGLEKPLVGVLCNAEYAEEDAGKYREEDGANRAQEPWKGSCASSIGFFQRKAFIFKEKLSTWSLFYCFAIDQ